MQDLLRQFTIIIFCPYQLTIAELTITARVKAGSPRLEVWFLTIVLYSLIVCTFTSSFLLRYLFWSVSFGKVEAITSRYFGNCEKLREKSQYGRARARSECSAGGGHERVGKFI